MRTSLFALIAAVLSLEAQHAYAENRAIIWGGNCNDRSDAHQDEMQNGMLKSMGDLGSELKQAKWKTDVLYDSTFSDQIVTYKSSLASSQRATKATLIEKLRIAATELHKGDQLLLSVFTHGSNEVPSEGDLIKKDSKLRPGHGWCIDAGNGQATILPADDPELLGILKQLHEKEVKVAITDSSCFGGGSIPVFRKYACVVSTQSALAPSIAVLPWNVGFDTPGQGASGGVMDILADMFRKHRTDKLGNRALDIGGTGRINMESAYIATLLNFPDRRLKESKAHPRYETMIAQISASPSSFVEGEWWADFMTRTDPKKTGKTNRKSLTESSAAYREKTSLFSGAVYEPYRCELLQDPFSELNRFLQNAQTASNPTNSSPEEAVTNVLSWDDRRTEKARVWNRKILFEELQMRIQDYEALRLKMEDMGQKYASASQALDSMEKYKVAVTTAEVFSPELWKEIRDNIGAEGMNVLQHYTDPDTRAKALKWLSDPSQEVAFEIDGKSTFGLSDVISAYADAIFPTNEDLSVRIQGMSIVSDSMDRFTALVDRARSKLPKATQDRIDELERIKQENTGIISERLMGQLNQKKAELQQMAVQARFYQYVAHRKDAPNQDAQNCTDFVLFEEPLSSN